MQWNQRGNKNGVTQTLMGRQVLEKISGYKYIMCNKFQMNSGDVSRLIMPPSPPPPPGANYHQQSEF
jgi:hypothetical protein